MATAEKAVLVDTSVLIYLLRGRAEYMQLIRDLILGGFILTTSAVNIAELYAGMRAGEEQATAELLSAFRHLPLTPDIAQRAGEATAARRRMGRTHTLDDMMIAATALEYGYTLVTDNPKDFQIPGLALLPLP
jgi:predicted nucleic acid-binding protein